MNDRNLSEADIIRTVSFPGILKHKMFGTTSTRLVQIRQMSNVDLGATCLNHEETAVLFPLVADKACTTLNASRREMHEASCCATLRQLHPRSETNAAPADWNDGMNDTTHVAAKFLDLHLRTERVAGSRVMNNQIHSAAQ